MKQKEKKEKNVKKEYHQQKQIRTSVKNAETFLL